MINRKKIIKKFKQKTTIEKSILIITVLIIINTILSINTTTKPNLNYFILGLLSSATLFYFIQHKSKKNNLSSDLSKKELHFKLEKIDSNIKKINKSISTNHIFTNDHKNKFMLNKDFNSGFSIVTNNQEHRSYVFNNNAVTQSSDITTLTNESKKKIQENMKKKGQEIFFLKHFNKKPPTYNKTLLDNHTEKLDFPINFINLN